FILKYDSIGNLIWTYRKNNPGINSEGIRIKVKSMDQIFVGGNYIANNNQDIAILRCNKSGEATLEKTYNGPSNARDQFMDMVLDTANHIFVSGRSYNVGSSLDDNIII